MRTQNGPRALIHWLTGLVVGLTLGLGLLFLLSRSGHNGQGGLPSIHAQSSSARRVINLPGKSAALPFSDGILVGNTLYLSGRLGTDPKTGQVPADLDEEIRLMLDGFQQTLAAAGMTMDHLVTVTVYCPDLTLYDRFNAAYRRAFTKDFPARAFIGSGPLLRGAHFEIQGIAVR